MKCDRRWWNDGRLEREKKARLRPMFAFRVRLRLDPNADECEYFTIPVIITTMKKLRVS